MFFSFNANFFIWGEEGSEEGEGQTETCVEEGAHVYTVIHVDVSF